MTLRELQEAYKVRKLALDNAKKEEEKYKALLKDAMKEAGEKTFTDAEGYTFERVEKTKKKLDEESLLVELHNRGLEHCIQTVEKVNEEETLKAVESGQLPQEVLTNLLTITPEVALSLKAPKKSKK